MSTVALPGETRIVIDNVSWSAYDALVAGTQCAGTRFTYDRGVLEIMSPSLEHERVKRRLGRMVEMLTFERNIPISSSGSTTLRDVLKQRGLEPDECYYIAHERAMRARRIRSGGRPAAGLGDRGESVADSVDKLSIYADLGVPEIWTFADDRLEFYQLQAGETYRATERSVAFPFLKAADLQRFLDERHGGLRKRHGRGATAIGSARFPSRTATSRSRRSLPLDLQPELLLDLQQRLGVPSRVVHGIVRMPCLPQMLEVLPHVLDQTLVERAQVRRLWPKGFWPRKWWKYQLTNCQSKPLLSDTKIGCPRVTARTQSPNCRMTAAGSSNASVSSRVNPLTASASGTHFSETGRSLP